MRGSFPVTRLALPGNEGMIIRSALTPLRESVSALPAYLPTAGRQGGASSRLTREPVTPGSIKWIALARLMVNTFHSQSL